MLYPERNYSFLSSRTTGTASANTNPWDSKRVLNAQLQDLMSLALASSTQSTYSSAVKQFLNFCMEHGVQPLPVDRRKLVYFAVALRQSLSTSTIKVYLSAVGSLQRFKDLTHHNPQLKMVLWGTRQTNLNRTSHPRQPIMRAVLQTLVPSQTFSQAS